MSEPESDTDDINPKGNQPAVIESDESQIRVNAGAGTGKTSTMVWKIERQIKEQGANPERILALTFANKAATNVETRVAEELDSTLGYNISSYTYHSFCHQLLNEYAYYTDHPPDFELITESTSATLIQEIVQKIDFDLIEPMTPGSDGTRDNILEDTLDFIGEIKRSGHSPDDVESVLPAQSDVMRAHRAVQEIQHTSETLWDLDTLFADGGSAGPRMKQWLIDLRKELRAIIDEFDGESEFLTEIADYIWEFEETVEYVQEHLRRDGLSGSNATLAASLFTGHPNSNRFQVIDQNPFIRLQEYVDLYRKAHDFTEAYRIYEQSLEERNALDYDGLIQSAAELLNDDTVGDEIRAEWDYVYCDEFQDTHHAELDVVDALGQDSDVLVIGDTDQAIYEWRGTSPENLEDLTDIFPDITSIDLNLNFRSYQGILDFTANLGHTDELTAHRGRGENEVVKVDGYPDREAQAEQVASTVSHLLQGRFDEIDQYEKDEIAVIVRKNSHARTVAEQLDAESIPFSVSTNSDGEQSPGVETVLSYFRLLVDHHDDTNLYRVLLHLYGLPESDLRLLSQEDDGLYDSLVDADPSDFAASERVERAISDITYLQKARKTSSLSGFYEKFLDRTKIQWYLTEDERQDLAQLENKIEGYDDKGIQSMLTSDFVDHLDLQETISRETIEGRIESAEKVDDKVNLMTVHGAKGLDFEVVLIPYLSDDEWPSVPGNHAEINFCYDVLQKKMDGDNEDWLTTNLADLHEEWRTLHVAITRAKDHLFFYGNSGEPDDNQVATGEIDQYLGNGIEWSVSGAKMNLWSALTSSFEQLKDEHPQSAIDLTDVVNDRTIETKENITYWGNVVDPGEAESQLLDFAGQLRAGELDPVDPTDFDLRANPGSVDMDQKIAREHSHSSLETFKSCPRRHYLDHVVYAFDDSGLVDISGDTESSDPQVDYAAVGTLFHDVAEEAYWHNYTAKDEWLGAVDRLGTRRGLSDRERARAKDGVNRFFTTPVSGWTQHAAEWPFVLEGYLEDIGGVVKGYIDGIYRNPAGELVVLDYKNTKERKDVTESYQLLLYLEALNERLSDEEATQAGYVYVGEAGPEVDLYDYEQLLEFRDDLHVDLRAADVSSYGDPDSGLICAECLHHSLGCADPKWDRRPVSNQ
ncbi:ATP-dependent helicase [Halorubrum ezzemoulense]|uniref:ATP-dependent helicase n=1 Tax=Halorubrum ezzemoulense TaxID=337243 RepID=UPI00232FA658|nr:ATP-dependent DNA helicase [Halorubrum ezzemoulense]MDB9235445.1 ATP-dependent DNA helicase [Halorubrum ezzemoulense]